MILRPEWGQLGRTLPWITHHKRDKETNITDDTKQISKIGGMNKIQLHHKRDKEINITGGTKQISNTGGMNENCTTGGIKK